MTEFEIMQELDNLSELKERLDPRYAPIVDAKINYRLQQMYKSKEQESNVDKRIILNGRNERE